MRMIDLRSYAPRSPPRPLSRVPSELLPEALVLHDDFFPPVYEALALRERGVRAGFSVTLNYPVGGFNPRAVEAAAELGAIMVVMPTRDSWEMRRRSGEAGGLSVFTLRGELDPKVREILAIAARRDMILATGLLAPGEAEVLLEEARATGVRRLLAMGALAGPTAAAPSTIRRMLDAGALLELPLAEIRERPSIVSELVRAYGAENIVVSSALPLGSPELPKLLDALSGALGGETFERLAIENPARLLKRLLM